LVKPKALPNIFEIIAAQKYKSSGSRTLKTKPKNAIESPEKGSVTIDICIDKLGKVVSASKGRCVNITDANVIMQCIALVKKYEFETDLTAPERECGNVTFKFSTN
jgi:hypothetical protein